MNWLNFCEMLKMSVQRGLEELTRASYVESANKVIEKKENGSATRAADVMVQQTILNVIGHSANIYSEHMSRINQSEKDYFVVLDPIDGTTNFFRRLPFFTVSMAAGQQKGEQPTLDDLRAGFVVTSDGDWYIANKDQGTTLNGHILHTSQVSELDSTILRPSSKFSPEDPLLGLKFASHLYLGSTSLELALLAKGAIDVFLETKKRKIFDFAASYLLVLEAGGVMTDLNGNSLDNLAITQDTTSQFIAAANRQIHQKILSYM